MTQESVAYRVSEFCERYVISKASFYREVSAKRLRVIKRGHTTLITREESDRWFQMLIEGQK